MELPVAAIVALFIALEVAGVAVITSVMCECTIANGCAKSPHATLVFLVYALVPGLARSAMEKAV
eukprot:5619581-Amphidinium_carterae.1